MAVTGQAFSAAVSGKIETPIFRLFEQQVRTRPDAVAVVDRDGTTTYGALHRRALGLAAQMAERTQPEEPIVIALPVGVDYVAAILGALAAGRPYVPLDLSHPVERQAHVVRHCGARMLCSTPHHANALRALLEAEPSLLDVTASAGCGTWSPQGTPDSIAYVLYTSGSTGTPKGVFQNQRGLAHDALQYGAYVGLGPDDVLSGLYSPSVVGSVRDIHAALIHGARVVLIDLRADGIGAARQALSDNRVSVLHAMPPVFRLLFGAGGTVLPDLRLIYLAGDRLFCGDLAAIRRVVPEGCRIYTGIGSTECSTLYRHWFVPPDWPSAGDVLPVGLPIPDRDMEIIRPDGSRAAPGEIGEIAVTSRFVALGYWRDPERTAHGFVPSAHDPLARTFRPGDLGRLRPDGLLEFHGRADRHVKIRGTLVDPGQIEAWLRTLEGVGDAAVIVPGRDGPAPRLVAFIEGGEGLTADGCRRALAAMVPSQLVPSHFIVLDQLPRLANFKVDYSALASRADTARMQSPSEGKTASTDVGRLVAEELRHVLRLSQAPDTALFSELGGDSLQLLDLHLRLEKRLQRHLPRSLFEAGFSIATLAEAIAALPEPERRSGSGVRYVLFPALLGPGEQEFFLRDAMADGAAVTILVYPAETRQALEPDISDLVDKIELEKVMPAEAGGPVVFIGLSFGVRVAYEAAARLARTGRPVSALVLIDSPLRRFFFGLASVPGLGGLRAPVGKLANAVIAWVSRRIRPLLLRLEARRGTGAPSVRRHARWTARRFLNFSTHYGWIPARDFMAPTLLIVADNTRRQHPEQRSDLGWTDVCHNITVREYPGEHGELCCGPNLPRVAACIERFVAYEDLTA